MPNSEKRPNEHPIFCRIWWISDLLLIVALAASVASGVWEVSVREYLRGFPDAVVPEASTPVDKVEAILAWMRSGPPRLELTQPSEVSLRDPQDTLNYRQLVQVCGGATDAFLNLSRSAGLETRQLLLLIPECQTMQVVAESFLDQVVVGWVADHRLRISRSCFKENRARATAAFFTSPEIK